MMLPSVDVHNLSSVQTVLGSAPFSSSLTIVGATITHCIKKIHLYALYFATTMIHNTQQEKIKLEILQHGLVIR